MDHLLYGCAYYDEYMPYERLDKDLAMMKKAGINVIRIAESTWSTEEPEDGVFDFSHVTKVLEACEREKIHVIIGTPTYAIPSWMAKKYPDIMVTDKSGRRPYGARQIMDITHHAYRFYCERIIRKLHLYHGLRSSIKEILKDSITISDWITGVTKLTVGSSFQV